MKVGHPYDRQAAAVSARRLRRVLWREPGRNLMVQQFIFNYIARMTRVRRYGRETNP